MARSFLTQTIAVWQATHFVWRRLRWSAIPHPLDYFLLCPLSPPPSLLALRRPQSPQSTGSMALSATACFTSFDLLF